jgi:hypothetical protein
MPSHPCAPASSTAMSFGPRAQFRHATPLKQEASTIDHQDCFLPREGHCVTPAWVFVEIRTSGKGPGDHETLHHVAVLKLVTNEVCVVQAGLLKESPKVVCSRPRLIFVAMCGSHDAPRVRAACLPLRMLLAPLRTTLSTILGIVDGNIE